MSAVRFDLTDNVAVSTQATLSSFGGLHSALLSLGPDVRLSRLDLSRPAVERRRAGGRPDSGPVRARVGHRLWRQGRDSPESLESALLSYETIATRKRPGSDTFRPVLLPTLKFGENSASGQSLGSMGAFLRETTQTLEARLQDVDTLADMLEGFDAKSLDEIEEMFEFPAEEGPEADRRGKIAQELQALHARCRSKLESSLRES